MLFKIEWTAVVGRFKLDVSASEQVEAPNTLTALNLLRTTLITKLNSLNAPFFIKSLNFQVANGDLKLSLEEQHEFLKSINAEGGLIESIPKERPPYTIQINGPGNMTVFPTNTPV